MKFRSSAPSNIALIKYMGKEGVETNRPTNSSLSFTLDHLTSVVELEFDESLKADDWSPLKKNGLYPIKLSEKGLIKFTRHLNRVREHFDVKGFFHIRSANQFPSDAGIASSASSYAALTRVAIEACLALNSKKVAPSVVEMAELSRLGSGSSCRSFFSPWALWSRDEGVKEVEVTSLSLEHELVVIDAGVKAVSSSEAHLRVATSALFRGRPERAEIRLRQLLSALRSQDWQACFDLVWAEFWDMHALFETAQPPFGYMRPGTIAALSCVRELWRVSGDGPVATLDAGANVHLLWRQDQKGPRVALRELFRENQIKAEIVSGAQ